MKYRDPFHEAYAVITEEQAIEEPCPKCCVAAGFRCIYVSPNGSGPRRHGRVGTKTKRVHDDRRQAVRKKLLANRPKREVPSRLDRLVEIADAEEEWDLREHAAMRRWLGLNAYLLVSPTRCPGTPASR